MAAQKALSQAVKHQWRYEAVHREQLHEADQMAIEWKAVNIPLSFDLREHSQGGPINALISLYAANPMRMIIVGEAGSGKTALCVRLTLELLNQASAEKIPIVFQLSSWNPEENFQKWLLERLREDYSFLTDEAKFGATAIKELLNDERLLPILDGLDELPKPSRTIVLETVRKNPIFVSPFVLTCRSDEFREAAGRKAANEFLIVRLIPLDRAAAASYLQDNFRDDTERWEPILRCLNQRASSALAATLVKPLMLYLARTTYEIEGTEPGELLDSSKFPTAETIENHLLDRFVPTVFAPRYPGPEDLSYSYSARTWSAEHALHTLTFLAEYLNSLRAPGDRNATDLSWWRIAGLVPSPVFIVVSVLLGTAGCSFLGWMIFGLYGMAAFGTLFGLVTGILVGLILGRLVPEPPRQFVPRGLVRNEFRLKKPLLRDAGFRPGRRGHWWRYHWDSVYPGVRCARCTSLRCSIFDGAAFHPTDGAAACDQSY